MANLEAKQIGDVLFQFHYVNAENVKSKVNVFKTSESDTFNVRCIQESVKGLVKARGLNKKNIEIVVDGRVYSVDSLLSMTSFINSTMTNILGKNVVNDDLQVSETDQQNIGVIKRFVEYTQIYHLDIKELMSIDEHTAPKYMRKMFDEFCKHEKLESEFTNQVKEIFKKLKFQ